MATIQTLFNDDPAGVRVTLDTNRVKINDNFTAVNLDLANKYVKPALGIPMTDLALSPQQQLQASKSIGLRVLVTSWAEFQEKHDALVAAGGGDLHFVPGATYTPPTGMTAGASPVPVGQVVVDVSKVGIQFNGALIDVSGWYGADVGSSTTGTVIKVTGTTLGHNFGVYQQIRRIENGHCVGSPTTATSKAYGPVMFEFDTPTALPGQDSTTANCILENMYVIGFFRGAAYGRDCYFVRWNKSFIARCYSGIYTSPNVPTDPSGSLRNAGERNHFSQCVVAENRVAVDSTNWGMWYCFSDNSSIDYNQQLFNLDLGSNIFLNDVHIEFSYGNGSLTGGTNETTVPIFIRGANTGVHGRHVNFVWSGKVGSVWVDPQFVAFADMDNGSQQLDLEFSFCSGIGRHDSPTSYDSFVKVSDSFTGGLPHVRLRFAPNGIDVTSMPTNGTVCEAYGSSGMFVNGISWPHGQLLNSTKYYGLGTAGPQDVSAGENGVPLKTAGKNIWKFQNNNPGLGTWAWSGAHTGNATIGTITCTFGAIYNLVFSSATAYTVYKADGSTLAAGTVGTVFNSGGLSFTVTAGGTPAVSGDKIQITAGSMYFVTIPRGPQGSRMAWSLFTNATATGASGSVVIKEMYSGAAFAFDGQNPVLVRSTALADGYTSAGVTITAGTSGWNRTSWKEQANNAFPPLQMDVSNSISIVFDLTNFTGPFYTAAWGAMPLSSGY